MLDREVGIRFNGTEKTNVEEYCVSEGWVRVTVDPGDPDLFRVEPMGPPAPG